jgi:hypothetical protein
VQHWADGGKTELGNLITLCGFHHRLVHEGGYGLKVTHDGLFVFTRPDGRRVAENGAKCFSGNKSARSLQAVPSLYLLNRDAGLAITRETARCQWHGESMDYSQAIEAMQLLEQRAVPQSPVS